MSLSKCYNIDKLRARAKSKLPSPMFHYIDGGADDEITLRRNTSAFDKYALVPNCLRDVSSIDTSSTLMGRQLEWPMMTAPTGMNRLFHHDKEIGVAKAAKKSGVFMGLSTIASTSIADIATVNDGPKMYQLYIFKDRSLTESMIEECRKYNYDAICLTIDTVVGGNRERDLMTGFTVPPKFTPLSLLSFASRPEWVFKAVTQRNFNVPNVEQYGGAFFDDNKSVAENINEQFDRTINWEDVKWLRKIWDGKLVVKGVHSAHDAKMCEECGVDVIMISNHGGRQMDSVRGVIECLPEIKAAVSDKMELIVDGGIRRGTHIFKALALGATAVSVGRAYLYGLAAGGEAGVDKTLTILRTEFERDMALMGCAKISDINADHIRLFDQ